MKTVAEFSLEESIERQLERKRLAFIADYGLEAKPALIWQCLPMELLQVDIGSDALRIVLQDGASTLGREDGWWYSFQAHQRPTLVFEGLASSSADSAFVEVHVDGHFIAGVWTFPELSEHTAHPGPAVASFYVDAFRDATYVASKIYEAVGYSGSSFVTCTMHHANKLPLARNSDQVLAPAVGRETLRWPVQRAAVADLPSAGTTMATQFMRIYGRNVSSR